MIRSLPMTSLCSRDIPALKRAGAELLDVIEALQARGRNVVTELQPERAMQQWDHYPANDANDPVSGYRWYYHAHPGPRADTEHGHFHVFAAASTLADAGRHIHLIGLSVSADGMPVRAFTTNRWVTNELYAPAGQVLRRLQQFAMRTPPDLALVHRWLAAVLAVFRPQIRALLVERDERLSQAQASRPNVFEDRRTIVLSQCALDLRQQLAWIDSAAGRFCGSADTARRTVRKPRTGSSIVFTGASSAAMRSGTRSQRANRSIRGDIR
jgi:hypothetical protein